MVQNAEFFFFWFCFPLHFRYLSDTVSSAPKRMRCRTFSLWSDFETILSFEIVRAYGEKNNLMT